MNEKGPICEECNGTGLKKCSHCQGTGQVDVLIPPYKEEEESSWIKDPCPTCFEDKYLDSECPFCGGTGLKSGQTHAMAS